MARFCISCGKPVQDGYAFCNHCGKPLPKMPETPAQPIYTAPGAPQPVYTAPTAPTAEQPVYIPPVAPITPPPSPVTKKKKWWIAPVAGVAALAVLLACLLPGNTDLSSSDGVQDAQTDNINNGVVEDYQPVDFDTLPTQDITRTVMIYILGSDLETEHKAATLDIQEMVSANIDTSKTQVLIYTGGARYWHHSSITANENAIYLLEQNGIKKVDSTGKKNMAEPSTLSYFLHFCADNYPADRYSLILWDHGGGPMGGYGSDQNYGDDDNPRYSAFMTMSEMLEAMADSPFGKQNKLEMLGFDACLMGSVECAWLLRDYANYYVASEESEPGYGWNYLFLEGLTRCQNGAQMGQLIIDTYFDFYKDLFEQKPEYYSDLTLSCTDLSRINTVESRINSLFANVNAQILEGKIGEASRCRYRSKAFGKSDTVSLDLIDLTHITTLLKAEYPTEAEALLTALDGYVTYSRSNIDNAYGASIYHPYDDAQAAPVYIQEFNSFNFAKSYATYISNFVTCVLNRNSSNTAYRDLSFSSGSVVTQDNKSDLSITLTQEQMATFAGAEYYVFYALDESITESGDVEYFHVFSGQDYTLSANGVLSATYDGKAVFAVEDGEYTFTPLAMQQIYDGSGEEKFYFPCTFHKDNFWSGQSSDRVNWMMNIQNGKPVMTGAYLADDDGSLLAEKMPIDSDDYDYYSFINYSYVFDTDPEVGTQVYYTGYEYGWNLEKGSFEMALRPLPDRENYYAVFAITDIYGNRYFSDVTCLGN